MRALFGVFLTVAGLVVTGTSLRKQSKPENPPKPTEQENVKTSEKKTNVPAFTGDAGGLPSGTPAPAGNPATNGGNLTTAEEEQIAAITTETQGD